MSEFEGFAKKEASTGAAMFHGKHAPMKVGTKTSLPPGHPTFEKPARKVKSKPLPSTFA